jgi:hypothetical protein
MRLLHTDSLELEEFQGEVPRYAILSHTWEGKEITYEDVQNGHVKEKTKRCEKIRKAGLAAAKAGFGYIWIDTCCIDKTNNTELTEAINSMYNWYQEAGTCFAYLADVPSSNEPYTVESFSTSKWFTRGWTLQELIGPSNVIFFASDWTRIGTKDTLSSVIFRITSIPERFLLGDDLRKASVAQRMSWAAKRKTTKEEDIAYCLLGIFNIQMPLIYGERKGAFRRLQEEIIKVSDDQSIFAWRVDADANTARVDEIELLARSPSSFEHSGDIIQSSAPWARNYLMGVRASFDLNNKGLHLVLPLASIGD